MHSIKQFADRHAQSVIRAGGLFKNEETGQTVRGRPLTRPAVGSGGVTCVDRGVGTRFWFRGPSPLAVHPATPLTGREPRPLTPIVDAGEPWIPLG